jgi:hypothetical protein
LLNVTQVWNVKKTSKLNIRFKKMHGKHNLHIKFWSENKKIRDYLEEVEQYLNGS